MLANVCVSRGLRLGASTQRSGRGAATAPGRTRDSRSPCKAGSGADDHTARVASPAPDAPGKPQKEDRKPREKAGDDRRETPPPRQTAGQGGGEGDPTRTRVTPGHAPGTLRIPRAAQAGRGRVRGAARPARRIPTARPAPPAPGCPRAAPRRAPARSGCTARSPGPPPVGTSSALGSRRAGHSGPETARPAATPRRLLLRSAPFSRAGTAGGRAGARERKGRGLAAEEPRPGGKAVPASGREGSPRRLRVAPPPSSGWGSADHGGAWRRAGGLSLPPLRPGV